MKQFNPNTTKLIVSFVSEKENEEVEWEITDIPSANFESDTIRDSENSTEVEFTPFENGDIYKAVLYVNNAEGNMQLFNDSKDEEITDFEIKEIF